MTPRELQLYAEIFEEKQEEKLTLIWMGEYLQRVEEMPTLKEFVNGGKEETKEMSSEEMLANVMQLNAEMGGAFEKVGE
jgi:hypothetical protein